jgi:TonB family protein
MKSKLFSFKSLALLIMAMTIMATGVAQKKSTPKDDQKKAPDVTITTTDSSPSKDDPNGKTFQSLKIAKEGTAKTVEAEMEVKDLSEPLYYVSEKPVYNDKENPIQVKVMQTARYPAELLKDKVEGIVIVQVVVEKNGTITNPKVISSVHPKLDAEALRAVKALDGTFTPAKHNGEVVRCYYQIPVPFLYPKK